MITKSQLKNAAFRRRVLSFLLSSVIYLKYRQRNRLPDDLDSVIRTFVPPEQQRDLKSRRKLIHTLIFCRLYYQIEYKEYFFYNFGNLSDAERKQYVGFYELKQYFRNLNKYGHPEIFDNKENTYLHFKDFFSRDVLCVRDAEQEDAFASFLNRHSPCVLKPLKQYGGKGIQLLSKEDVPSAEKLFSANRKRVPFLLEEIIEQDPVMAAFHPQSVNTIRYNTFFHEGSLIKIQAVLRMGRGDNFVDNATSGGIFALVDTQTGRLSSTARADTGEIFFSHPDTGIVFKGVQIPRWDELNSLLERIVRVIPEQKQVGWDFALSKDGWVLVEANTGPALQSFDLTHGLRKLVAETFGQVVPVAKF